MNWTNVATIVALIAMVAIGGYFIAWMTKNQKRAAAEYRAQMDAAAAREAGEPDVSGEMDDADAAGGGGTTSS
jgi:hypothetical protein